MQITPLHEEFGAKVTGIDMSVPLDDAALEAVKDVIDTHSFVWFPDQAMDDDKQMAFTKALGSPESNHVALGQEGKLEYFGTIGNVQADGTALGSTHKKVVFSTGNNLWHSDASFKKVPASLSIMCAYETPAEGGETLFVSGRAAYDRLDEDRRAELDPLVTIHDYTYSRSKVAEVSAQMSETLPPVRQRLVRTNPANGKKNLFLGSHVREIEGWGYDKSRPVLDALVDEAVQPDHIYSHAWAPGDLVIWDNRCLIHRGAGYDADRYRRYMRQTRVSGLGSSLEE